MKKEAADRARGRMGWLQEELARGGEVHLGMCSVCFILDGRDVAEAVGIIQSGAQE